jgi:putative ABC transport system permease protein
MLKNYIITALRSINRNRVFGLLNALGLALGLTCCLVYFTILRHEYSFDNFHQDGDRIYRIVEHQDKDGSLSQRAILPNGMSYFLRKSPNDFEAVIPLHGPIRTTFEVAVEGRVSYFEENRVVFATSEFLEYMNFPILTGQGPEALDELNQVFLSSKIARKYFGESNPIGQTLVWTDYQLTVAGVLDDIPTTTNVPFEMLISFGTIRKLYPDYMTNWEAYWMGSAYVVAKPESDIDRLQQLLDEFMSGASSDPFVHEKSYRLQPLAEVHTDDRYSNAVNYVPPAKALYGSGFIVLLILIASILNFINLSTSRAIARSKEVGVRKTLGVGRFQLITQFLVETFFIVIVALIIGFTFGQVIIDLLNQAVSGMSFKVGYDWSVIGFALLMVLVITPVAGWYPSMILSKFSPLASLRNQVSVSRHSGSFLLRKALILVQFFVVSFLLIELVIFSAQMNFMRTADLGFDPNNIIEVNFPDSSPERIASFKAEIESLGFVQQSSWCFSSPQSTTSWNTNYRLPGQTIEDDISTNIKFIDRDYLETFGIELIAGSNIENIHTGDSTHQLIVNETFANRLNIHPQELIGQQIDFWGTHRGKVVGVTRDFHFSKLNRSIRPILFIHVPRQMNLIAVKVNEANESASQAIEEVYRSYHPDGLFKYSITTDQIEKSYTFENAIFGSVKVFTIIAVFIGIIGLYGLIHYLAASYEKVIGIRKVFGADKVHILIILARQYLIPVISAFVLAVPGAYLAVKAWLDSYPYRIDLSVWYFVEAFVVILALMMITVTYKSIKTANLNPIESLRSE